MKKILKDNQNYLCVPEMLSYLPAGLRGKVKFMGTLSRSELERLVRKQELEIARLIKLLNLAADCIAEGEDLIANLGGLSQEEKDAIVERRRQAGYIPKEERDELQENKNYLCIPKIAGGPTRKG